MASRRAASSRIAAVVAGIVFIFIVLSFALSAGFRTVLDEVGKVEITDDSTDGIDRSKRSLPSNAVESPAPLDFTIAYIQRIFNQTQNNKNRESFKEQLKQIKDQLNGPNQVLYITSFENEILKHQTKINNSLASFSRYLDDPNNQDIRNSFYQQAAALPTTLQALLDILGRADIVPTLRDALKVRSSTTHDNLILYITGNDSI